MARRKVLTVEQILTRADIWQVLENVREPAQQADDIFIFTVKDGIPVIFTTMNPPDIFYNFEVIKQNLINGGQDYDTI